MFIIMGVIVISILFVLSYDFGNIHAGFMEMMNSNQNAESDIILIARSALLLFMMVPIACTGDITSLFTDDENASFYKVASALPISISKRVACRFLAGYLFIAIGMAVDLVMTIILSSLTDMISFGNFCGVIITFSSVMLIYISLLILLMYILGNKKSTYAGMIPLLLGAAVYILANFDKFKDFMVGSNENALLDLYHQTTDFIFYKSYILFIAAIILSSGAYLAAVQTAKRKRGVA
ncbi:MAG: ABC-2 transporter permease [Bacteroidales bacterium]|nr:ABC-2 transporter permease [Lachnoclostridium sp.]MCM1384921.1 ABC-2 transporter permease [Lachnoclostridium sp.]MCM1465631.1 ABC-2 transporter permease [Bacteroidales bacterium]